MEEVRDLEHFWHGRFNIWSLYWYANSSTPATWYLILSISNSPDNLKDEKVSSSIQGVLKIKTDWKMTLNCTPATHQVVVRVELPSQSACFVGIHCRSALACVAGVERGTLHCQARFTGMKSAFSRITQNSAFDFICRPYSIAKLRTILNCLVKVKKPLQRPCTINGLLNVASKN